MIDFDSASGYQGRFWFRLLVGILAAPLALLCILALGSLPQCLEFWQEASALGRVGQDPLADFLQCSRVGALSRLLASQLLAATGCHTSCY